MGWACAAAALCLLLASLCSSTTFVSVSGYLHHNASLPVTRPKSTTEIVCKFEGNKVFEWEPGTSASYFGPFSGRTELKEESVLIQKLQKNDAGFYLLQFTLEDGKIEEVNISLKVVVPLSMPTINCSGNASIVYLGCYLNDHDPDVTTEWKHQSILVISNANFNLSNENKHLTISNPEEVPGEYTCIVKQREDSRQSNPLLVHNCFEEEGNSRGNVATVVVVALIIVASLAVLVFTFWQKRTKDDKTEDKGTHVPLNTAENPEEREPQNIPVSPNVKDEDKVTHEASLELKEEQAYQNNPASNEPEKIREDSADIDSPKDTEQAASFAPDTEQEEE